MYQHVKKLMYTVKVGTPDVRFGSMLLEQFGGDNGELVAAMQYTIQGWSCARSLARARIFPCFYGSAHRYACHRSCARWDTRSRTDKFPNRSS